jgi:Zn finger protein HypA/HybF involved in hydrogenase expression
MIIEDEPKLLYCENCNLEFNSYEKDMYTIDCPYCDKKLNEETINEYYRFLRTALEQLD